MDDVPRCCLRRATRGPERVRRSEVAGSDVDDTILAPYVYRETAALKDLSIGRLSRGPQLRQACSRPNAEDAGQSQQRKDEGGSFQGPQFSVGNPFPLPPFADPSALEG